MTAKTTGDFFRQDLNFCLNETVRATKVLVICHNVEVLQGMSNESNPPQFQISSWKQIFAAFFQTG
jgi:hypothetical protein